VSLAAILHTQLAAAPPAGSPEPKDGHELLRAAWAPLARMAVCMASPDTYREPLVLDKPLVASLYYDCMFVRNTKEQYHGQEWGRVP
jgi:hypothetical protein